MMTGLNKQRWQIAYFSPLPPARSGISDYSSELLPYLAQYADMTLFSANSSEVDEALTQQFAVYPLEAYPEKRWQYDVALYQMGNSVHHEALYRMFLRYPGIVVLHDYSLHHFMAHRTVGSGDYAGYLREIAYELGGPGLAKARMGGMGEQLRPFPLNKRLIDLSLGVLVHSQYVQDLILARTRDTAVTIIPQPMPTHNGRSRRHQLSWPQDAIIFASVGQVTAAKQIEFALRAFKKIRQTHPNAFYLIIGEEIDGTNLTAAIQVLDLTDSVRHIGYIADKQEFIDWIYTADIIVNLRYPTVGETSATALRALAAGKPLVVFDHGWYSELPDAASIKIPPLDEKALFNGLSQLAAQPQKRQLLGRNGRHHIQNNHHPAHIATAYIDFIQQQLNALKRKYEQ